MKKYDAVRAWQCLLLLVLPLTSPAQTRYEKYGLPVRSKARTTAYPGPAVKPAPLANHSGGAARTLTNDDVPLFPSTHPQAEVHISVDPTNARNLIASANTYTSTYSQGYYYSNDGGATWKGSDDLQGGGASLGDPATAYDAGGYAYVAGMIPDATGYAADGYFVQTSSTKGPTWSPQVRATGPSGGFDKNMIAADNTGSSPFVNNLYAAWTDFDQGGIVAFNRSTTRGNSFTPAITLNGNTFGQGTNVQTGPNGEVYVCWADYGPIANPTTSASGVGFVRSTDGGVSFTNPAIAVAYAGTRVSGGDPVLNNTGNNDFPAMAVDKSYAHRGRLYVVVPAHENGTGKYVVRVCHSDDQGATWSGLVTASIASGRQNWLPWIAVDNSTGDICVIYYSLDTASGFDTNTYVAHSSDGGATFDNTRVSDVSHVTTPINNTLFRTGYIGDYLGITAAAGKAYPVWSDNRTGTWQLYTSPLSTLSISGPSTVCSGSSATFTANNGSVIWSASPSSLFTTGGGYGTSYTVTTMAGATGQATISATFYNVPGAPVITKALSVIIPVAPGPMTGSNDYTAGRLTAQIDPVPGATSYNWYKNNVLNPTSHGTGAIWIIPRGGCGNATVSVEAVFNSCTSSKTTQVFPGEFGSCGARIAAAYPNPATDVLTVQSGGTDGSAVLYDVNGLARKNIVLNGQDDHTVINIRDLPAGIYHLRILHQGVSTVDKQIVVQH